METRAAPGLVMATLERQHKMQDCRCACQEWALTEVVRT